MHYRSLPVRLLIVTGLLLPLSGIARDHFQIYIDSKFVDTVRPTLACVFERLDKDFEVVEASARRAMKDVENRVGHGFFSSGNPPDADNLAMKSAPLILEKWYWYVMPEKASLPIAQWLYQDRIAALSGSSELSWLEEKGASVVLKGSSVSQMFKLLELGRVDAILLDESKFTEYESRGDQTIVKEFYRYAPQGIYFADWLVEQRPDFLSAFNEAVFKCNPHTVALSEHEQQVMKLLVEDFKKWGVSEPVVKALQGGQKSVFEPGVSLLEQDIIWRTEFMNKKFSVIRNMLEQPLSQWLRKIQDESGGLINEILLMDHEGRNFAVSKATSDYWQGDEDKFLRTYKEGPDAVFIDNIEFDESTSRFQSQVSFSIPDPEHPGASLGAITVGVDIENALSLARVIDLAEN